MQLKTLSPDPVQLQTIRRISFIWMGIMSGNLVVISALIKEPFL